MFALLPAFIGLAILVLLNAVLTRQVILDAQPAIATTDVANERPLRIMVFLCMMAALGSVALAVILGLSRYMPVGSKQLASGMTISSIFLLSSNLIIFFARPLGSLSEL